MNPIVTKDAPMPRRPRQKRDNPSSEETRRLLIERAIQRVITAAVLVDPIGAMALLDISAKELGQLGKNGLWEAVGVSTILDLDLPLKRDEHANPRKGVGSQSKLRTSESEDELQSTLANAEPYRLVRNGKLLRMEDYLVAADVTEKQLRKFLASGKVFSVELEAEVYVPAFFLSPLIPQSDYAKVIRGLSNASGWDTWDFFTTPTETLAGSTPLQFLAINKVKPVLKAAEEFAKR